MVSERTTRIKKIIPIAAVIALLLIGTLAVYALAVRPSKQPYRDALSQYQNVYNANVAFTNAGSGINASSATDEQFTNNMTLLRSAMKNLEIENTALGQKSSLNSGRGKELYETFNTKFKQYITYNEAVISSIEALRPVLYACSDTMTSITQDAAGAAALRACAQNMEAVKNIPNKDYEQLARAFVESYNGAAQSIEQGASLEGEADTNQTNRERNAFIEDLNKATQTLARNLQASREKVDITESAMALDDYLKKQSSIF